MYNVNRPTLDELPTTRQLLRSTLLALVAAVVILATIVLPSEYGIDPTGLGRTLGLTEMGEIKVQLAEEAALDAAMSAAATSAVNQPERMTSQSAVAVQGEAVAEAATGVDAEPAPAAETGWRDEMQIVLTPGQGAEVKLSMQAGEQAEFSWFVEGGVVNFDTHGNGAGQSISYEKGRAVPGDEGTLEAAFDGKHGWFWRNRGEADVTVIVRARGEYLEMTRVI